jgi:hypothetical protein
LAHRGDQVAMEATNSGHRPFGIVSTAEAQLVPPLGRHRRIRHDLDYFINVGLDLVVRINHQNEVCEVATI